MNFSFLKYKEFKNASWIIGGKIARMVFSLMVSILSARLLGPSNFGLVNYGLAYVNFFVSLSNLGIQSIIIKDFIDNPTDQGKALGTTIILRLYSSLLSIVSISCISFVLDRNEPITIIVVILSSLSLLFRAFDTIEYYFQYQYLSKVNAILGFIAHVIASVYKIALLLLGASVKLFALSTSVDYLILALLLLGVYRKKPGPKFSFSVEKAKSLLASSYHYILSNTMVAIYGQVDKLMLKQIINQSEVGYYSIATSISNVWVFALSALIVSMRPTILRLHKTDHAAFLKRNKQLYALVFYVSVCVAFIITIFSEYFINLLYGKSYIPSANVLSVLTWLTAFSFLGVARDIWVVSEGKQKYLKYMYLSAVIINIFLNSLIIPRHGAIGAAVASLITQIFTSMILPAIIPEMRPNVRLMLQAIALRNVLPQKKD